MAKAKTTSSTNSTRKIRPALTPENDQNQCIALAMDLVKQRLIDGTASSQETTHFLKLATTKARLEQEILEEQKKLIMAKTESIQDAKDMKSMYEEALKSMQIYAGRGEPDDY